MLLNNIYNQFLKCFLVYLNKHSTYLFDLYIHDHECILCLKTLSIIPATVKPLGCEFIKADGVHCL